MKVIFGLFAALILFAGLAITFAPVSQVETQVRIQAPADAVWAVLADTGRYPEWNPLVTASTGRWDVGETISNQMQFLDGDTPVFEPKLLIVEPARELRWLGRLWLPRIADGEHYFVLLPDEGETVLTHGERFDGIVTWFLSAERFRADFERFNAALKARVEGAAG